MHTQEATRPSGASPSIFLASLRAAVSVAAGTVLRIGEATQPWYDRWRQRQALMRLDDHLLKDIGVSRADAESEAIKPFWKE
ncbi:DUF1127 domain-containing protein [Azospirillum sp. TSO22-1]|uniref:DUF1127 domain-containing protein n=1 Tax=Azospirillum sp. TSO22-1 TaxID=716789 RepID=UPI000D60C7A6|nr:DUF1127 domain-containing protein [Azospirillum sp. TSO22-1]PWC53036.1 hypothetical protein TSO221_12030 [Azospirillum sp. TSO22-1]